MARLWFVGNVAFEPIVHDTAQRLDVRNRVRPRTFNNWLGFEQGFWKGLGLMLSRI